MSVNTEIHNIIENVFGYGQVRNLHISDQIQVNCPKCQEEDGLSVPDGKFNLEINTKKKKFRCWRCDDPPFSGGLGRLIKRYGLSSDYELYIRYAGLDIYDNSVVAEEEEEDETLELPAEYIPFNKINLGNKYHREAYTYLTKERQLDPLLLNKFNVGFCCEGKYKQRIIIPSYNSNGDVNYFISRTWFDSPYVPKYDNPEAKKNRIIFNESRIKWDMPVYLVEGAFDMLSIPINTIPLLGKTISEAILEKLIQYKPSIFIVLDPDAIKKAKEILVYLVSVYGKDKDKIKLVELPNNDDIDELRIKCGMETVIHYLKQARNVDIDDYFKKI